MSDLEVSCMVSRGYIKKCDGTGVMNPETSRVVLGTCDRSCPMWDNPCHAIEAHTPLFYVICDICDNTYIWS